MNQFKEELVQALTERFGEEVEIEVTETVKNNGTKLERIMIGEKSKRVAPLFYLEDMYDSFKRGIQTVEEIADEIYNTHVEREEVLAFADTMLHYEQIKDKVYPMMVNYEANEEDLKRRPHVRFLDLAKIAIVRVEGIKGNGIVRISHELLQKWDIDEETLFAQCQENAERNYPSVVTNIFDMLDSRRLGIHEEEEECIAKMKQEMDEKALYIITNREKHYGADAICNMSLLEELSEKYDKDLYIIPSSVHEILFMYDDIKEHHGLDSEGVKMINETQVRTEERLSNSIYRYDRKAKQVVIHEQGDSLVGMKHVA